MKKRIFAAIAGILIIALVVAFGTVFAVNEVIEVYEDGASASNLQSGSIAKIACISTGDNILSINETSAIRKVNNNFADNSVDILDIERVFPNKVIIYIKQRIPIAAMCAESGGYALADIDFQLNKKATDADFNNLIFAEGITVVNTFNTSQIKRLREALLAAKAAGFTEEGLSAFIARIRFETPDKIVYTLRSGGIITAEGTETQLTTQFIDKYAHYIELSDDLRCNANL